MPTIRFVTAGALTGASAAIITCATSAFLSGILAGTLFQFAAAGDAVAQSATGKPLQLMQAVQLPAAATKRHHRLLAHAESKIAGSKAAASKTAASKTAASKIAASKKAAAGSAAAQGEAPAQTAAAELPTFAAAVPASASIWPIADTRPPIEIAAIQAGAVPLPVAAAAQRTVVVNGETVEIAAPNDVNDLDRAAGMTADAAIEPAVLVTQAAPRDLNARDFPATKADILKPLPQADRATAMSVAAIAQGTSGVISASELGSVSWLAQAGAALGGAIAAGLIAWLLIGGTPQRMYG